MNENTNNKPEILYAKHILEIKMWEWQAIVQKWDMEISKDGPEEYTVKQYNNAIEKYDSCKRAIEILSASIFEDKL